MISGALLAAIASSGSVSEDFQAILSTVVGSDTSSVTSPRPVHQHRGQSSKTCS